MNAFRAALADEVATAWATLLRAREQHDETTVTSAVERLRDLEEISDRVSDAPAPARG